MKSIFRYMRRFLSSMTRFRQWGQGLVEFALMLPVLLIILMVLIEAAFIIQGYMAVQHAAREAARWAVSYRPVQGLTLDEEYCTDSGAGDAVEDFVHTDAGFNCDPSEGDGEYYARRAAMIKETAVQRAAGLRINGSALALTDGEFSSLQNTAGFFGVRVWGDSWTQQRVPDHPGLPGLPVHVQVVHRVQLVDPFLAAIAPNGVRVRGSANMINEGVQVWQPSPTPYTATPFTITPLPSATPSGAATSTPTPTPLATSTPPPGGYCIDIPFDVVTNTLPHDRGHTVEALVYECTSGDPQNNVLVSFSTSRGAYHYSGEEDPVDQYAEGMSSSEGIARRRVYANEPVTATLTAWIDIDGDNNPDAGEVSDQATKIWVPPEEGTPYILASNYWVYPEDWILVDVYDHPVAQEPFSLLWCRTSITGGLASAVLSPTVSVDANGDALMLPVEIPLNSSGYYRLETHSGAGSCGAPGSDCSAVACSAELYAVPGRPDLTVESISVPAEIRPETLFTMTVVVSNTTSGLTNELFDVDFYLDPGGPPATGDIGVLKQWISGIDPYGRVTVNTVMWVGELGPHEI